MISIHQQRPKEDGLNGIIWKLKNEYIITNPIASNYVVPSSSYVTKGHISTTVLWDLDYLQVSHSNISWIQLTFPRSLVFPSAYSLRGVKLDLNGGPYPLCHGKSWNVYGIIGKDKKKELISRNSVNQSQYCAQNVGNCYDLKVGTFDINGNISDKGYTAIRWEVTELDSTCPSSFFSTSAIDIYGVLVPRLVICTAKKIYANKNFIFITLLLS